MMMDNLDNLDDLFEDNLVSEESNSSEPALVIQDIDSDELFTEEMFSGSGSEQSTVISKLLQDRGITDNKITIIDESGEEQEVDFFTLSPEEQLDILNSEKVPEAPMGDNYEGAELIQYLKENNLTLEQFLENYKNSILETATENVLDHYEIDAYDDEELYMLDLKNKFSVLFLQIFLLGCFHFIAPEVGQRRRLGHVVDNAGREGDFLFVLQLLPVLAAW